MSFLENIIKYNSKTAIICENKERVDYKTLIHNSEKFLKNIKDRSLVFLLSGNNFETIVSYIGLLKSNCVIVFINENTNFQSLKKLINIYKPHYIFGKKKKIKFLANYILCFSYFDYSLLQIKKENKIKIHDQLKIMMPTSGSTGSEKYVRLSEINLVSNTKSIIRYLKINQNDVAITTLPISYVYGLSIINTHLHQGSSIVLNNQTILSKKFWKILNELKVTNFNGVPYIYEILDRLKFESLDFQNIRYFTQAGGKLNNYLSNKFINYCKKNNKKFYTMYGSAEATARMSYVPWKYATKKIGSVGLPISGGKFWLEKNKKKINKSNVEGELVYSGKNVSMGYALNINDLSKGDNNHGILRTGDIAKKDSNNYYYIVGRKDRYVKIFGNRVNLFELEQIIFKLNTKSVCFLNDTNKIDIYVTINKKKNNEIIKLLNKYTDLHSTVFKIINVKSLPLNKNLKISYNLKKYE